MIDNHIEFNTNPFNLKPISKCTIDEFTAWVHSGIMNFLFYSHQQSHERGRQKKNLRKR